MTDAAPGMEAHWRLEHALRHWQSTALARWHDAGRKGIVKVVTGAGKTLFALACMMDFERAVEDARVIILVPTVSLLDQWWVSLQDDLGVNESDIATYSGGRKPTDPRRVNLMVINTGRIWAPRLAEGGRSLLIVDECHRAGSPLNALALQGPHAAALGISATPEREGDDGFASVVVPALGPLIYQYGYNEAATDNVISPFNLINVEVGLSDPERMQYEAFSKRIAREIGRSRSEDDEAKLRALLLRRAQIVAQARMRIPVAVRLVERYAGERAVVFHERIDAAQEIHDLLVARGHAVSIYHSHLHPAVRRDNLRQYRRGVFDVLVTCRALDEGIDVPETAVAVIASSTGSARQRIQRLGRALRPTKGKSYATILTVFATERERVRLLEEESDLREARSVTWERAQVAQ